VWLLGLSGLLAQFQATLGIGFSAVYYHCKGYMDFCMPEFHDILLQRGAGPMALMLWLDWVT
jgi:hypothetical protein